MNEHVLEFDCIGITDSGKFPVEHTGRGEDRSPEFIIKNRSPEAETFAITLEDLTHPVKNFTHWVIWNIPAADRIGGGIPAGKIVPELGDARQGLGYGFHRYAGPKPPKGSAHQYRFTVYALDCQMELPAWTTKKAFLRKAQGHILQKGSITGEFE